MSEGIELFVSSSRRESGRIVLMGSDQITVRVTDAFGRCAQATISGGEWSKLIANPKQE